MIKNNDAQALLREWVKRLGLHEWRIMLYPNSTSEDTEGAVGCTEWQEAIKTAKITIIDEREYGERIIPFDFEKTLVHELLHIKTCLLTDSSNELQERVGHMMIDDLARALVDAKRSKLH